MALPGGFSDSFYGGFFILTVGTLLLLIGVFTKLWSVVKNGDTVRWLYKACSADMCGSYTNKTYTLIACQAFGRIGVTVAVTAFVATLVIFLLGVTNRNRSREMLKVVLICSIVSLVMIVLCVVIWGVAIHDDMSYSFKLSFSFIITIIGGVAVPIGGLLVYSAERTYF